MIDWIPIQQWSQCATLQKPGYAFEIRNGDGDVIRATCTREVPTSMDWTKPAVEFRLVKEEPPRHSSPMPKPAGQD